ncbi:hypothetical protein VSX64_19030 [Aurantimonas sp. C2-6-R+9]|uniref:HPF/RaiA family ribosome-associated protein n=1 Tax=unclassified Aurantimonas TaxID=2638230 RepID=UPI002E1777DB|nr:MULTISPECIES: hypothetical protein [unclassified Aurantimonas]MEC5292716.1 hypothetical protein [Aurantimonas sp. C2-3-R2]MEC5382935.1 hypothetical protein [Aurantimonas sp. C2-6-R+9]MEC5413750.1 hypothetical protein [Aurantimonas sp. C2-4-R8]
MDIEIRTDSNIDGDADMVEKAKNEVEKSLGRFDAHVTSIHIHFSDASAGKEGLEDIQCMIEARMEGRKPEAVTEKASTTDKALGSAIGKMRRLLDSEIGKMRDAR